MPPAGLSFTFIDVTCFFKCRSCRSTTGGRIATRIVALKPSAKNLVNFGPVTPEILLHICMGGECREANIRTVPVEGHPLGGSSMTIL